MKRVIKWIANNPKAIAIAASIINTIAFFAVMFINPDLGFDDMNILLAFWTFMSSLIAVIHMFFVAFFIMAVIYGVVTEGWEKFKRFAESL